MVIAMHQDFSQFHIAKCTKMTLKMPLVLLANGVMEKRG